jgi:glutaredoxin
MDARTTNPLKSVIATILLWFGLLIGAIALAETLHALPVRMPRLWYISRPLCLGIGLVSFVIGFRMLADRPPRERRVEDPRDDDGPTLLPGVRFHEATLYTKPGCSPCEQALAVLEEFDDYLPEVDVVDIRHDSVARELYEHVIPVLELDGQLRLRLRITRADLIKLITETAPLD